MAELIAQPLVSTGIDFLIKKLSSPEVISVFRRRKLDDGQLQKLKISMRSVRKLLNDAEQKQFENEEVKAWLEDLKDVVFEADDFLDEIAYEAMQSEMEAGPQTDPPTCGGQVRSLLSSLVPCRKGIGDMQPDLERILHKLEVLVQQKDHLGLIVGSEGKPSSWKIPTTSGVDEYGVYGREADKEAIMKLLLSDEAEGCRRRIDVVPIVGMPGVGKTTLAQSVYDDITIADRFGFKAWVYVSEEFNIIKVTKDILKKLTKENCDTMTEDQLHTELLEKLKEKKVLIVLDDVWSDNQGHWDFILKPFVSVKHGSKMLITTRHESVASARSTVPTHHLQELSEEDCWVVFEKHAFVDGNSNQHPDLKEIGRDIVKKCRGLPLAARALGDHLRCSGRRDVEYWEKILNSNLWDLSNDNILPALRLSYYHLPPHLKQCFAYCGMFPRGFELPKEIIVLFWMAEGFLGNIEMEKIGDDYFRELLSRSFFKPSNEDTSCFVMHDLLCDLAKFVAGEFCFAIEDDETCQPNERARYLSGSEITPRALESICKAPNLRSLIMGINPLEETYNYSAFSRLNRLRVMLLSSWKSLAEIPDSIGSLKHLRLLCLDSSSAECLPKTVSNLHHLQTLILDCTKLTELPESIGNLKQLRYLSLPETSIGRLPESASGLCNLRTLNLHGCFKLVELPADMMKLTKLCHLDIGRTHLQSMPSEMGKLVKLKQLSDFFVGKQNGSSIKELGSLQNLQGKLRIWNLQNVENVGDATAANLKGKKQLEKLKLTWGDDADGSLHHGILEQLQPHTSLKSLEIVGYGSERFPNWVGDPSFSNIETLHLQGCKHLSSLPPLGHLSSLKKLSIIEFEEVTVIGPEFYGGCAPGTKPFASLEFLKFVRMKKLQQWQDRDGAFLVLRDLYIRDCPNLTTMPIDFPSVTTLEIDGCKQFPSSLPRCPFIHKMFIHSFQRASLPRFQPILSTLRLEKGSSGLYNLKVNCPILDQLEQVGCLGDDFEDIEGVEIRDHDSLEYFPLNLYRNLYSLAFINCPKLNTFTLESHDLQGFTSLTSLSLSDCPDFNFPTGGFAAPNLTQLEIYSCLSLQSLPESMHSLLPSLENLGISSCPELESFPPGGLPSKLQSIMIVGCDKLIANRMLWGLPQLPSLSTFTIGYCRCQDVESFPEEKLLPPSLTYLRIYSFENLKTLNYKGLQHLTSLKNLDIYDCYDFLSFPEEGLPSSLSSLTIYCLTKLESLDCKVFQYLNSLTELKIDGCPKLQFLPGEGQLSSLSSLKIFNFKNLRSLDYKWIQHLKSLKELEFRSCNELQSFPEEGLPSSLSSLKINDCHLLAERCAKKKGDYWPMICHIPYIEIDWRRIN